MQNQKVELIDINRILPNPHQPRKNLNKEKIEELAKTISLIGLLQPIVVNYNENHEIILIAGQRRLEAYKLLNKKNIECLVIKGNATEKDLIQASMIENIQREEMSSYEISLSVDKLYKSGMTQEKIAHELGKSVSWVCKMLAIDSLSEESKTKIEDGTLEISKGAIIAVQKNLTPEDKDELIQEVIENKITKKELEQKFKNKNNESLSNFTLISEIEKKLDSKVEIKNNKFIVRFLDKEDLNRILEKMNLLNDY